MDLVLNFPRLLPSHGVCKAPLKKEKKVGSRFALYITFTSGLFFHRFLGNTNKWICRILEFRKKIHEFRRKTP